MAARLNGLILYIKGSETKGNLKQGGIKFQGGEEGEELK